MEASKLSIAVALLGGILTVLSPCILPILPLLIGRSLQTHRYAPVALVAGLVGGFAFAGSLLGLTASWIAEFASFLRVVAIALLLILGILAILPDWSYRLWGYFPVSRWVKTPKQIGLLGEFWIGTQLGLLWTPCAGSILGGILILAAVERQVVSAFGLLVAYGVGAAIPMLAIAYGGRVLSQRLLDLRPHSVMLQRVGGVIIVATAIAILMGWDVRVQLLLAPFFPTLGL